MRPTKAPTKVATAPEVSPPVSRRLDPVCPDPRIRIDLGKVQAGNRAVRSREAVGREIGNVSATLPEHCREFFSASCPGSSP
jgi:hypothetical protein